MAKRKSTAGLVAGEALEGGRRVRDDGNGNAVHENLARVRLRLPFCGLPEGVLPSHPERLQARLDGPRRRVVHAIFQGLQAEHAKVRRHRRTSDCHVEELYHVIWWLLDRVDLCIPTPLADGGEIDPEAN